MLATLEASSLPGDVRVVAMHGKETLCRPFHVRLHFSVSHGGNIDVQEAIGEPATITLSQTDELSQEISGIFASVRLLTQTESFALYEAEIVPKLWHLGLTKHSRAYTKIAVPDLIDKVLKDAGLTGSDYELRLTGSYNEEALIVQYRESDLHFLHRWMEHEGIYYFFEHADGAAKMVIVDDKSAYGSLAPDPIPYDPAVGADTSAGACFDQFHVHFATTVSKVKLTDYDYARPMLDVSAEADVSEHGFGEMRMHRARFWDPSDAKKYATLRAEALKAQEVVHHASGTALRLSAGHRFDLTDHVDDRYNTTFLAVEVSHFVNQLDEDGSDLHRIVDPPFSDDYRVQVVAINATLPYRPPRVTRRPRVWGYESGIIDGETDSEYAQIDDQGRYLVKFQFDETELDKGKGSTWVRMMQPHGGNNEGFHFPLRKGTEVVFTFQGGDPDRPVIAGVVPNMLTQSPVHDANHTQNVIQTGSKNRIVMEDKAGNEFIHITTPKETTGFYLGNPMSYQTSTFDGDKEEVIKGFPDGSAQLYTTGHAVFEFGKQFHLAVTKDRVTWVGGFFKEEVDGKVTETYNSAHHTTVTAGGRKEDVSGGRVEDIKGLEDEQYKDGQKTFVTGTRHDTVTSSVTEQYGPTETTIKGPMTFTADGFHKVTSSSGFVHSFSGWSNHEGGAGIKLKATDIHLHATNILLNAPSVTNTTPKEYWEGCQFDIMGAKKTEFTGFSKGATGIALGFTGVKIEGAGFVMGNEGIKINKLVSALRMSPSVFKSAAIDSALSGLTSFA